MYELMPCPSWTFSAEPRKEPSGSNADTMVFENLATLHMKTTGYD